MITLNIYFNQRDLTEERLAEIRELLRTYLPEALEGQLPTYSTSTSDGSRSIANEM